MERKEGRKESAEGGKEESKEEGRKHKGWGVVIERANAGRTGSDL